MKILGLALLALAAFGAVAAPAPPADRSRPERVGGDVTRPEKLSGAFPLYTEADRKAGAYGNVIVEAIIDRHGDVRNVRVVRGIAKGLDEQTVAAVETWKFKPATKCGVPVPVYYSLSVHFHVETDSARELLRSLAAFRAEHPEPAAPAAVAAAAEACRKARGLPAGDGLRAALIASGLEAVEAAIAGRGAGAGTASVAEAEVYEYQLMNLEAESIADPAAQKAALEASRKVLRDAQETLIALSAAGTRASRREAKPSVSPNRR